MDTDNAHPKRICEGTKIFGGYGIFQIGNQPQIKGGGNGPGMSPSMRNTISVWEEFLYVS